MWRPQARIELASFWLKVKHSSAELLQHHLRERTYHVTQTCLSFNASWLVSAISNGDALTPRLLCFASRKKDFFKEKEMSTPIAFRCAPLTDEQRNRFHLLVDDERDQEWWAKVFSCGAFIAGGAALFVFDKTQCVKRVGDVDIWTPQGFPLLEMVKSYCDLLKLRKIDAFIRLQNYIVTIVNPQRNTVSFLNFRNLRNLSVRSNKGKSCLIDNKPRRRQK